MMYKSWIKAAFLAFFILGSNGYIFSLLKSQGISQRVYLRDLFFSEIRTDVQITNEDEINRAVNFNFKEDTSAQAYTNYLRPEISKLLLSHKGDDRSLALAITQVLGTSDGSICGLETLGQTVFDTSRGMGCCSDFSKSFLFYANYLGLQAREVSLFNHTTVEYLNRSNARWQWLDPYNRVEIVDTTGQPLSLFQIRQRSLFGKLKYNRIGTHSNAFDANDYAGYAPSQMGTILWRRGTNFLEVEAWDRTLQGWGFSKSMRQAVMLVSGVQPGWLMVTTHADAFYYKTLRAMLWGASGCWFALNLALFFVFSRILRALPEIGKS